MLINRFPTPYLQSNMYLITEGDRGIIIDPYDGGEYIKRISGLVKEIDYIFLTHEHFDHISGTDTLRERFRANVLCSEVCADKIKSAKSNASHYFAAYVRLQDDEEVSDAMLSVGDYETYADETFTGEEELQWEGHKFILKETPGHSPGSICILLDQAYIFTGDTLLDDDTLMTRFPGGSTKMWEKMAFPYLESLPKDTVVKPGHYDEFILGNRMERYRRQK